MNRMKKLAEMFGVKLEEVFYANDASGQIECIFTESCLERHYGEVWLPDNNILIGLLTGAYKLKKVPWKPQLGEYFYYPKFTTESMVEDGIWTNDIDDKRLYERGLICQTNDAALQLAKIMLNSLGD